MTDIIELKNRIKVKIYGPNLEIEDADINFETILTDEKDPNECTLRIYNLTERVSALEYSQQENSNINNKVPLIENKVDKAHQRIDLLEHDLLAKKNNDQ